MEGKALTVENVKVISANSLNKEMRCLLFDPASPLILSVCFVSTPLLTRTPVVFARCSGRFVRSL